MDDAVNVRVLFKDSIEGLLISDIEVDIVRSLATDELNAVQHFSGGVLEIVCNDHFVIIFEEREGCKGANVTGASGKRVSEVIHAIVVKPGLTQ